MPVYACVFKVNRNVRGGESYWCKTLCAERLRHRGGGVLRLILGIVFFFQFFAYIIILGEVRRDCFSQNNADADVVCAHIIIGSSHLNS